MTMEISEIEAQGDLCNKAMRESKKVWESIHALVGMDFCNVRNLNDRQRRFLVDNMSILTRSAKLMTEEMNHILTTVMEIK